MPRLFCSETEEDEQEYKLALERQKTIADLKTKIRHGTPLSPAEVELCQSDEVIKELKRIGHDKILRGEVPAPGKLADEDVFLKILRGDQ